MSPDLCTHWTCMNQLLDFSGVSFLYVLFLCRFYVTFATWPRQVPCQCTWTFNMTGGQALWKLCAIKSWSVTPWVYMMMCRYAESIGATHFVTSAKLNAGINEVFLDVAHRKCSYWYRCSWTMVRVQCIWRGSEDYGVRNQDRFTVKELPHTTDLACLPSFQGCKQLPI